MQPIYQPQGKAREFSPLALNIYNRCNHACRFCYVPKYTYSNSYFAIPEPRANLIPMLQKELSKQKFNQQVLLSFIGDPYNSEEEKHALTRQVLEIFLDNKIPMAILTKGGKRCLRDIDLFKKFDGHIKIGASLTFFNEKDSLEWEPGAALPKERFGALKELHENEIITWASLEPVISPEQTLRVIDETHEYINHYKIGKINHMPEFEKKVDWSSFLDDAVSLLRSLQKPFYVKRSLQVYNRSIIFDPKEINQDHLNVPPW